MIEQKAREPWQTASIEAGKRLAELGPEIVDLLLLAVGSDHRHLKLSCIVALSELGEERALDVFVEGLSSRFRDTARWSTRGLMSIGEAAVPPLIEAAASDQARLRRYAVRCLGHMQDPRAREALLAALEDADETVCRQASVAVGKLGRDEDAGALAAVVRHRAWRTGAEAVDALATVGDVGAGAVERLALVECRPVAAAWLWRQRDDLRARAVLVAAVPGPEPGRSAALSGLASGRLDAEVVELLLQRLLDSTYEEDPPLRRELTDALIRSGSQRALQGIVQMARAGRGPGSRPAVQALGRLHTAEATEALMELLDHRKGRIRSAAADALWARFGTDTAGLDEIASRELTEGQRSAITSMLQAHRIVDELASGGAFTRQTARELRHCLEMAGGRVAGILRERDKPGEIEFLTSLLDGRKALWYVGLRLLEHLGVLARPALDRYLAGGAKGRGRERAQRLLDRLAAETEEE